MQIAINGSGTLTGISVGGLPDGIVDRDTLAAQAKGSILQVEQTVKTDTASFTSQTFTDVSGMSVNITPSSSSSKILIMVDYQMGNNADSGHSIRLVRDSTAIYIADAASNRIRASSINTSVDSNAIYGMSNLHKTFLDSPSSTSQITYKVQTRIGNSGTIYINRTSADRDTANYDARAASSITVMEVAA